MRVSVKTDVAIEGLCQYIEEADECALCELFELIYPRVSNASYNPDIDTIDYDFDAD